MATAEAEPADVFFHSLCSLRKAIGNLTEKKVEGERESDDDDGDRLICI